MLTHNLPSVQTRLYKPVRSYGRSEQLQSKLENLSQLARRRKEKLQDNSAYLQFMWKADVVESWIADKEAHVKSEDFGRDLSTVQTLLTKQETFDAGERESWGRFEHTSEVE